MLRLADKLLGELGSEATLCCFPLPASKQLIASSNFFFPIAGREIRGLTCIAAGALQSFPMAGELRWVLASLELIEIAGEACIMSMFQDITERKGIEAALRQSEQRYQLITRATSDAVWEWDLLTHEVRWSQGLRTVFGYPAEALRQHTWWADHVHPEDKGPIEASVQVAVWLPVA